MSVAGVNGRRAWGPFIRPKKTKVISFLRLHTSLPDTCPDGLIVWTILGEIHLDNPWRRQASPFHHHVDAVTLSTMFIFSPDLSNCRSQPVCGCRDCRPQCQL